MHSGHRERTKNKIALYGQEILSDHELLEVLLFYSIPRKNTNHIAHNLINRFGSLAGVLDADINELCKVEGIGVSSAILIKTVFALHKRTKLPQTDGRTRLDSFSKVKKFLINLFSGENQEIVYVISLNNSYRLLGYSAIRSENANRAIVDIKPMVRSAISYNASYVILAHNHPGGIAIPSDADIEATKRIDILFKQIGIELLDHFVVAGDRCTPIIHTENLKINI